MVDPSISHFSSISILIMNKDMHIEEEIIVTIFGVFLVSMAMEFK